jgi:hypothetical protein
MVRSLFNYVQPRVSDFVKAWVRLRMHSKHPIHTTTLYLC